MDEAKALGLLGLAAKAGRLTVGTALCCEALRARENARPRVIAEASDTSEGTHKRLSDKCAHYAVPHIRLIADSAELARAVGKKGQLIAAVGVTEAHLAAAVIEALTAGKTAPEN